MFRISRRIDYGLQLMIALAEDAGNNPQSTASLSKRLSIPLPFLHQISHSLMQAGYIKATPGPKGGVRLNVPASSISALQIVEALEGPIILAPSENSFNGKDNRPSASTKHLWNSLEEQVINFLEIQFLDDLINLKNEQDFMKLALNPSKKGTSYPVN